MVDLKVHMWTKFRKKLWKKVKSPLFMNFWRISTSKCRGKLQKMGVLYTHFPKKPWPISQLPKILFFKIKKFQKNVNCPTGADINPRLMGNHWSPACLGLPTCGWRSLVARLLVNSGQGTRPQPLVVGNSASSGRLSAAGWRMDLWDSSHFSWIFFLLALHFFCKWSILAGWLQHMPTLPRFFLETSNTHDFWFIGSKNMFFSSCKAYCKMHIHKKFQKIQK